MGILINFLHDLSQVWYIDAHAMVASSMCVAVGLQGFSRVRHLRAICGPQTAHVSQTPQG